MDLLIRDIMLYLLAHRLAQHCDYVIKHHCSLSDTDEYIAIKVVRHNAVIPGITKSTISRKVVDHVPEAWLKWLLRKNILRRTYPDRGQYEIYCFIF